MAQKAVDKHDDEGTVISELDLEKLTEETPGAEETEEMGNRNL